MKRTKKLSAWAKLKDELRIARELNELLRRDLSAAQAARDAAVRARDIRMDERMLTERRDLAKGLGQMLEASARAIQALVAPQSF